MRHIGLVTWVWIKLHAISFGVFIAGAVLAACILIFVAISGMHDVNQTENSEKIAHDWQRAMMTLGINPVFPPSEDFHVGDVIAVDELKQKEKLLNNGNGPSSILFRTMGIGHAPGTEAVLQKHYRNLPQFPSTPKKYDGVSPVTADGDIFATPNGLKSLPIVGFPGITIATASVQTSDLGILSGIRAIFSGATRSASESVQIKIPEAETYGIDAEEAHYLLSQFCKGNFACTQTGVREALSLPFKVTDKVVIYFIVRVYLTRSIDYEYGSDTAVAAAVRARLDRSEASRQSALPNQPGTRQSPEEARMQATPELGGVGQGAQLTSAISTAAGVELKTQFARPIAIGYYAISISPFPDLIPGRVKNASQTKPPVP